MIDPHDDDDTMSYIEGVQVGRGESLDDAVKDAYEKLSRRGAYPPFRVVEIGADGTNPFSGFRAVIKND